MNFSEIFKGFNTRHNNAVHISLDENCVKLISGIKSTRNFFEHYSFLQFGRDSLISISPLGAVFSINGVLMSAERTLESIEICCTLGNFSDANILLRRYRDDLFFYLYIIIVSQKTKLGDDENDENMINWLNNNLENVTDISQISDVQLEEFFRCFNANINETEQNEKNDNHVKNINRWLSNELKNLSGILKYIAEFSELSDAVKKYNLKTTFDSIGKKLNDFVHANGISYYNKPYNHYGEGELKKVCDDLQEALDYVTVTFLFLSALCNPLSIMSSDYIDYLDSGELPPEGSQYWVAPFVIDHFQNNKKYLDSNCMEYIQEKTGMQLQEI